MQHSHLHNRHAQGLHPFGSGSFRRLAIFLFLIAAVLWGPLVLSAISHVSGVLALLEGGQSIQTSVSQVPAGISAVSANSDDVAFEDTARELVAAGTGESLGKLVQMLNQTASASHRAITLQVLRDAPSRVEPILIAALNDPDEGVRSGAAQSLGLRHDTQAVAALDAATRDSRASVRSASAQSLGELQAWQELPRLNQLQVGDPNPAVYTAARAAVETIRGAIASDIGLAGSQLVDVSVTTSGQPQAYAVTRDNLYVSNGTGWASLGPVPDNPVDLATGSDKNVLYLTTVDSGIFRSLDGGATWQHVQFGSNTLRPVVVTALAVNSQTSERLYAALATPGSQAGELKPLGFIASSDGGSSWVSLPDPPLLAVTTHLYTDPLWPGYLFGLTDDTPWRYPLPGESCNDCPASIPGLGSAP